MKKKIFLAIPIVLSVLILFSCVNRNFTVTFVVDGEVYHTLRASCNQTIQMPDDPQKEGYTFGGWFFDEGEWERPFTADSLMDIPRSENMQVRVYARCTQAHKGAHKGAGHFVFTQGGGALCVKRECLID